jgi:hypothetical protein
MKVMLSLMATALCIFSTDVFSLQPAQSGQNIFTCEVSVLPLDEGHSLILWKGKGVQVTAVNSPDHMSYIDCAGTVESMTDKSFKASGYCLHTDREGDKWTDRWWNDSTMKTGRFEYIGVSGKWKDMRGVKGNFVFTDLSTQTECRGVSNWEVTR